MKIYDLFSPIYQIVPRMVGKELGVQYSFPNLLKGVERDEARAIGKGFLYLGKRLLHYETGKVWKLKDIDEDMTPVMIDKETIGYASNGKTVYEDFARGNQNTGILAVHQGGVSPF